MNGLGQITDADVAESQEAFRKQQERALRPKLNIAGYVGIGLLAAAAALLWKKR